MYVDKSLLKDFSRLEELVNLILVSGSNHIIDPDKIELVEQVVSEGSSLVDQLSSMANDGVYDTRASVFLLESRVILEEAKTDLSLSWNKKDLPDTRESSHVETEPEGFGIDSLLAEDPSWE